MFGKANLNIFWQKIFQRMMFLMELNKVIKLAAMCVTTGLSTLFTFTFCRCFVCNASNSCLFWKAENWSCCFANCSILSCSCLITVIKIHLRLITVREAPFSRCSKQLPSANYQRFLLFIHFLCGVDRSPSTPYY